jgi:hypothetical protein
LPRSRLLAEPPQVFEREDAGVVAVSPDRVEPVGADEFDVSELVLARMELGIALESPGVAGLTATGRARTGAPQVVEANPVDGAVVPLDEQRTGALVVVEAERPDL